MKLLKDIWEHLKEWSEWGIKDWIKAGIVTIIVLIFSIARYVCKSSFFSDVVGIASGLGFNAVLQGIIHNILHTFWV